MQFLLHFVYTSIIWWLARQNGYSFKHKSIFKLSAPDTPSPHLHLPPAPPMTGPEIPPDFCVNTKDAASIINTLFSPLPNKTIEIQYRTVTLCFPRPAKDLIVTERPPVDHFDLVVLGWAFVLSSLLVAVLVCFLGKRQHDITSSSHSDHFDHSDLSHLRIFSIQLQAELEEAKEDNRKFRSAIDSLHLELTSIRNHDSQLQKAHDKLQKEIKNLKSDYERLQKHVPITDLRAKYLAEVREKELHYMAEAIELKKKIEREANANQLDHETELASREAAHKAEINAMKNEYETRANEQVLNHNLTLEVLRKDHMDRFLEQANTIKELESRDQNLKNDTAKRQVSSASTITKLEALKRNHTADINVMAEKYRQDRLVDEMHLDIKMRQMTKANDSMIRRVADQEMEIEQLKAALLQNSREAEPTRISHQSEVIQMTSDIEPKSSEAQQIRKGTQVKKTTGKGRLETSEHDVNLTTQATASQTEGSEDKDESDFLDNTQIVNQAISNQKTTAATRTTELHPTSDKSKDISAPLACPQPDANKPGANYTVINTIFPTRMPKVDEYGLVIPKIAHTIADVSRPEQFGKRSERGLLRQFNRRMAETYTKSRQRFELSHNLPITKIRWDKIPNLEDFHSEYEQLIIEETTREGARKTPLEEFFARKGLLSTTDVSDDTDQFHASGHICKPQQQIPVKLEPSANEETITVELAQLMYISSRDTIVPSNVSSAPATTASSTMMLSSGPPLNAPTGPAFMPSHIFNGQTLQSEGRDMTATSDQMSSTTFVIPRVSMHRTPRSPYQRLGGASQTKSDLLHRSASVAKHMQSERKLPTAVGQDATDEDMRAGSIGEQEDAMAVDERIEGPKGFESPNQQHRQSTTSGSPPATQPQLFVETPPSTESLTEQPKSDSQAEQVAEVYESIPTTTQTDNSPNLDPKGKGKARDEEIAVPIEESDEAKAFMAAFATRPASSNPGANWDDYDWNDRYGAHLMPGSEDDAFYQADH